MPKKRSALQRRVDKKLQPDQTVFDEPVIHYDDYVFHTTSEVYQRARNLATIYTSLKLNLPGFDYLRFRHSHTQLAPFMHAAILLTNYERDTQRRINDVDYVMAHLWCWGKKCFSTRLYSKVSIALYDEFTKMHAAEHIEPDEEKDARYDREIVAYLADLRGETPKQVERLLRKAGLIA